MHNSVLKPRAMKKTTLLILAFCAGMLSARTQTVVTASTETEYPQEMGNNVRICINESDGATVIFYRDANTEKNWFIYHKPAATTENKYLWPDIPEGTGYADCTVEDMMVIGDTLYFCGTATYPDGNVYKKKGYIGWVDVDQLRDPSGGVKFLYYSDFENQNYSNIRVVELSHLDGSYNVNDYDQLKIGLVGKSQYTISDTASCLLLVKKTPNEWFCQFHYITDTKETFTDIVFLKDHALVVPSRFGHEYEDHYRFGIRQESVGYAFSMPSGTLYSFQNVDKINTRYMATSTSASPYPTWHRSDVEIHVIPDLSCGSKAMVAYECEDTAKVCENRQQTALHRLDIASSPVSIISGQLVHGYFRNPYTLVSLLPVNVGQDSSIALLHTGVGDWGEMASTLLFPTWNHYGQIEGLLADYRRNTSMDVFMDQYIRLGGTSLTDKNLIHYHLDKPQMRSSCYSTRPTFYTEELMKEYTKEHKKEKIVWSPIRNIMWKIYYMAYYPINKNQSCVSYNLSN